MGIITFLIGFILGGLLAESPRKKAINTPPPIQPKFKSIDGVNVTKCKYYNECSGDCEDNNVYSCILCANIPNCSYKQLKRAEQKLEKIEDRVQDLDNYSEKNVEIMEDILTIIQGE